MNKTRRKFVSAIATATVAIQIIWLISPHRALAAGLPQLNPEDPAAKSLMYTHQSADAEWGACVIFPKKLVSAGGICNSWFKRAG